MKILLQTCCYPPLHVARPTVLLTSRSSSQDATMHYEAPSTDVYVLTGFLIIIACNSCSQVHVADLHSYTCGNPHLSVNSVQQIRLSIGWSVFWTVGISLYYRGLPLNSQMGFSGISPSWMFPYHLLLASHTNHVSLGMRLKYTTCTERVETNSWAGPGTKARVE